MTRVNRNIVRAAVLQNLGQPYSLIYLDTDKRTLYLAVRTSSPKEKLSPSFSAVITSREEIEEYMAEQVSLEDIFLNRKSFGFKIVNDYIHVNDEETFIPDQTFEAMKWYDSEFCEQEGWVEDFLEQYTEGKSFEIIY